MLEIRPVGGVALPSFATRAGAATAADLDALEAEIVAAREGEASLDAKLDAMESAAAATTAEVVAAREGAASLDAKLDAMEAAYGATTAEVVAAREGEASLDAKLDAIEAATLAAADAAALALLAPAVTDADTTHAPTGNAVYDEINDAAANNQRMVSAVLAGTSKLAPALDDRIVAIDSVSGEMTDFTVGGLTASPAETHAGVTEALAVSPFGLMTELTNWWVPIGRTISTTGLLDGGGSLALNRTLDVPAASAAETAARTITDKAVTPGGLDAALDAVEAHLFDDAGLSELASMWSATMTGEPVARTPIASSEISSTGADGRVVVRAGAGARAPRAVYRLLPGHKYQIVAAARRATNPTDPEGDSVSLRMAWLNGSKTIIANADLETFDLRSGDGLRLYRKVVASAAGAEVDVVAPAGTVYFTPFMQTYGSDGVTHILPYVRVLDLTSNTLISADVSGLEARVTALESIDAGTRLDALESVTGTPDTAWFLTVADATAATIGVTVDKLIVLGSALTNDVYAQYVRAGSGDFQSADGQWWNGELAASGAIVENRTFTIGPSGADFTEPGAFTDWLGRRRIMPGVTVTASIADGTYNCTKAIRGHIDGERLVWTNSGLVGAPLTGADFASLDAIWVIDPVTGITPASMAAAKAAADTIVRAKYKVILQFASGVIALRLDGRHGGDWSGAPCLFVNTGTCTEGVTTGTGVATRAEGPGGRVTLNGSCVFGFVNGNLCVDYGGAITFHQGLSLFPGAICMRADFTGGFYCEDVILIGGVQYGYRSNHGGFAYMDTAYIRGCAQGIEVTNSPGMAWAHNADIQYNYYGVHTNWGGTAKVFDAIVKNNARAQVRVANDGTIDAREVDGASTVLFGGAVPLYGISLDLAGMIDAQNAVFTGHTRDAYVGAAGGIRLLGATATNLFAGPYAGVVEAVTGMLRYGVPDRRPATASVQMSGTTLTLPIPCPRTISVIQPAGSAGTPISITTITNPTGALDTGQTVFLVALNAGTGETVTVTDSTNIALAATTRVLSNIRDVLGLVKLTASAPLSEFAYADVQ